MTTDDIARQDRAADRRTVRFQDRQVTWRGFGSGEALVLLHGGHGSWLHWVRNIRPLAERFTVWVPDMPGYGYSDTTTGPELPDLLDPLMASLDDVVGAGTDIRLVGFSFGGLVAAAVAARRQHVTYLGLFGAAGHGGRRRPQGKLLNWHPAAESGDAAALADVMRHNLAVHMLHDPVAIDDLALDVHTRSCIATRFRSKSISQSGGLAPALAGFDGQLLLGWGENDVTADPATLTQTLCAGRSHTRRATLSGAGHWVQYEAADAVNDLLLGWL